MTAEIITFPSPNEVSGNTFVVCDHTNEDTLVLVYSLQSARNIARIMSSEHPMVTFTVIDEATNVELFRVTAQEESQ